MLAVTALGQDDPRLAASRSVAMRSLSRLYNFDTVLADKPTALAAAAAGTLSQNKRAVSFRFALDIFVYLGRWVYFLPYLLYLHLPSANYSAFYGYIMGNKCAGRLLVFRNILGSFL